jgi:anti-anti-sigma regulatory factor
MHYSSPEGRNHIPAEKPCCSFYGAHPAEEVPTRVEELVTVDFRGESTVWIKPLPNTLLLDDPFFAHRFSRIAASASCESEALVIDLTDTKGDRDLIRQQVARIAIQHKRGREQQESSPEIFVIDNKYGLKDWAEKTGLNKFLHILSSCEVLPHEMLHASQNIEKNHLFSKSTAVELNAEFADESTEFNKLINRQPALGERFLTPVGQVTQFTCTTDDTITFQVCDEFLSRGGNLAEDRSVEKLKEELEMIPLAGLAQHRNLVFDLAGVERVSKEAIGAFIATVKGVREQRQRARTLLTEHPEAGSIPSDDRAILRNVHPDVREKLERLGILSLFFLHNEE